MIFSPPGVDFRRFFVIFGDRPVPRASRGIAQKTMVFSISGLNASWAALRALLGASRISFWTVLGLSRAFLGPLGLPLGHLGPPKTRPKIEKKRTNHALLPFLVLLGLSWPRLGPSWPHLGRLRGSIFASGPSPRGVFQPFQPSLGIRSRSA